MNTYKVIARLEYMDGVEMKPYTVTAYTESSAVCVAYHYRCLRGVKNVI